RRELGIRTAFNILGPLANPARVGYQALGVSDPALAPRMSGVLQRLGHRRALVMSGAGGLDELGLDAPSQCYEVTAEGVRELEIDPADLGLSSAPIEALRGGSVEDNADAVRAVLDGETGPRR